MRAGQYVVARDQSCESHIVRENVGTGVNFREIIVTRVNSAYLQRGEYRRRGEYDGPNSDQSCATLHD